MDVVGATGTLATGGRPSTPPRSSLYVATQDWQTWQWGMSAIPEDRPDEIRTDIHKFDISSKVVTNYVASGGVEGYLLNQFSMDEHGGLLAGGLDDEPDLVGCRPGLRDLR